MLHDSAPVVSMCLVGCGGAASTPQVASCDASGALHVWSLKRGEQTLCLREAPWVRPSLQLQCRGGRGGRLERWWNGVRVH